MIQVHTKSRNFQKQRTSGVTLIETLVVITVLAGLIAAVGASFTITLKSYTGEYKGEAVELEASRAALELEYYVAHARRVEILNGTTVTNAGNQVVAYMPNNLQYTFTYTPSGGKGSLVLGLPDGTSYTFSTNLVLEPTAASSTVFWLSPEGSLSYQWAVDTPSGRVNMGGSTLPGI